MFKLTYYITSDNTQWTMLDENENTILHVSNISQFAFQII